MLMLIYSQPSSSAHRRETPREHQQDGKCLQPPQHRIAAQPLQQSKARLETR